MQSGTLSINVCSRKISSCRCEISATTRGGRPGTAALGPAFIRMEAPSRRPPDPQLRWQKSSAPTHNITHQIAFKYRILATICPFGAAPDARASDVAGAAIYIRTWETTKRLPPGLDLHAEDAAGQELRIDVGVDAARVDADGPGGLVPPRKRVEEAQLRARVQFSIGADRERAGGLGKVLHRRPVALRDLVVARLAERLEVLGERHGQPPARRDPRRAQAGVAEEVIVKLVDEN